MVHRSFRSLILASLMAIAVFAATLPMSAGAQEASPAADCPPLSPEAVQARVQEFIDAVNTEDLDLLGGLLHDNYTHHWAIGSDAHDREGYLDSLGRLFDAYDNYSFTAEEIITADGAAVLRFTASGTQVVEFGGFPASDQPTTWTGILIIEFDECGQIVEIWAEADHLGRLIQQGSILAPEQATPAP